MFCKEVIGWHTLRHPNVVPFLGVKMNTKELIMISEWMDHGRINDFLKMHWEANPFELVRSHSYHLPLLLFIILPDSSSKSLMG